MLKVRRSQVAITTLGASDSERTKGILATKLNNTVPVNLHVITNQVPTSKVDVPQLHHIRNLKLADLAFNTPGKIDVLLGADVLEYVIMEAKPKDGGLSVRDSIASPLIILHLNPTSILINCCLVFGNWRMCLRRDIYPQKKTDVKSILIERLKERMTDVSL